MLVPRKDMSTFFILVRQPARLSDCRAVFSATAVAARLVTRSSYGNLGVSGTGRRRIGIVSGGRPDRAHQFPRIWKFQSTLQAMNLGAQSPHEDGKLAAFCFSLIAAFL